MISGAMAMATAGACISQRKSALGTQSQDDACQVGGLNLKKLTSK